MSTKIFVSLPVKDLDRSVKFFKGLGFNFNSQFTNTDAACMIASGDIYFMLLTHDKFAGFTSRSICDTSKSVEMGLRLSLESRAAVDDMVKKAMAAGATSVGDAEDHGFMYEHGFADLDGHTWDFMWMDAGFAQKWNGRPAGKSAAQSSARP